MNNLKKMGMVFGLMAASAFVIGEAGVSVAAPKKPVKAAPVVTQKATITLPEGYKTGAVTLKAGRPVALTFFLKSDAGCGNTVKLPIANWTKTLKVGEKATVKFTPKKSGSLNFSCSMDMDKGTILVK
jgi:plastocyanin domain-containing protein